MTLLQAGFEVAPSGTAIPLTGGPDGFASGSYNGSGTTFVSDSSVPAAVASGSLAGKITVGSTAAQVYREWSWTSGVVYARQYIYLTAAPNARFTWWENWNQGLVSRIRINTDRTVGVGTSSSLWLTTAPIPLNTLVRLESTFNHSAGSMSLSMFVGNSTTPISGGTVSVTGVSFPATTLEFVYGGVLSTLTNFTVRTDAWAVSDTAQPGPLVTGGVVSGGSTALVTASASAGSVTAFVGGTVSIAGVTAQVVAQGGVRPVPPGSATNDPAWPPDPYREAIRSGSYALTYIVNATYGGAAVDGAQDLRPTGGTITDTTKPGVRRLLNLELAPEPGLFDRLSPVGTTLSVTARVQYTDRTTIDIPMGVFDVDSESLSEGGGALSVTAPDKWVRIQRAKFTGPTSSVVGALVTDQIINLVQGALGIYEPVSVLASSTARVPALTWEKDRDKAIQDLAASIGAWVYFDRNGLCTIADLPTIGASADWLIDSSASGILIELDRTRSRTNTYNVVVVSSSAADGEKFTPQVQWDADPLSPTYAGPDPVAHPDLAGPFGVSTYFFDTPLPLDALGARFTANTILARTAGLASQASMGSAPNPAMNATDTLDVMPPKERYDIPRVLERHMADTVTHPLTLGSAQHIEGRSTRSDDYT